MTIKLFIGLTGPVGCGKTTAQRIIADRFGLVSLAFADPIEDATEWGHDLVAPEIWLRVAEERLGILEDAEGDAFQGAVIGDVRYPNQAEWLRRRGGTLIHLYRPNCHEVRAHTSEAGVPHAKGDLIASNDGDIDDLADRLSSLIDNVIDRRAAS